MILPRLAYYPVAHEDELLYGLIGRYHVHTCSPSFKQTLLELFGARGLTAVVDLPAHLKRLHRRTSHMTRQSVSDILMRHTLFPLFAPFLGPELAAKVRASMLSDDGGDVHTRAGIVGSRLKRPAVLRVCSACHREQVECGVEAFWQRLFQVTGVQVCPRHRLLLHDTRVPYVPFNKHQFWEVPRSLPEDRGQPGLSSADVDRLVLVAKDMRQLLNSEFRPLGHAHWTDKYWGLMTNKALTKGQKVNQPALHEEFVDFWGNAVLEVLSCQVEVKDDSSWLKAMARRHRKNNHPLMHVLFYRFLAGEDARLADLFETCSWAGMETRMPGTKRHDQTASEEDKREWLELRGECPGLSVKQLREHSPALYMRLYRQDRKWLLENSPSKEQRKKNGRRIDWKRRDRTIARKVVGAGKRYRQNPPPRRISKRLLADAAGCLTTFDKRVELLPITEKAFGKYSESIPEFQSRRIDGAVAILRRNGERVAGWRIYRMANIRPNVSPEVKQYIRDRVDEAV